MVKVQNRLQEKRIEWSYFLRPVVLFIADLLVVCGAMHLSLAAAEAVMGHSVYPPRAWDVLLPVLYMSNLLFADLYRTHRVMTDHARKIFKASTYAILSIIVFDFVLQTGGPLSRAFLSLVWLFGFWGLYFERCLLRWSFSRLGMWQTRVIIIGAGKTAQKYVRAFGAGVQIVGVVEDVQTRPLLQEYPRLGGFSDIESILKEYPVNEVILATPGLSKADNIALFHRVQPFVKHVSLIPNLFGIPIGNMKAIRSLNDQLLVLRTYNNLNRLSNRLLKRAFDLVAGSLIALMIMPIIALTALFIKLDSKGAVFYNAERIGKAGRSFCCYKFRSMYVDSDRILQEYLMKNPEAQQEWMEFQKLRGEDPRVTRVGRVIRKYSIDELPQIFNVLKGDMSLVGPRPYLPREKEEIGEYLPVICMTVPGMTGLWQVSGRSNVKFKGRLRMDSWYVRNWNLWQDIVILFKTIQVVLGRDAY